MLALDLDGTVLTSDKHVTAKTREALVNAAAAGIELVVVTGRPLSGLPEDIVDIPQIRYAITSNGAVITDIRSNETLRSCLIPHDITVAILTELMKHDLIYSIFSDGIGYCPEPVYNILIDKFTGKPLESYVRKSRRPSKDLCRLILSESTETENIWVVCKNTEDPVSIKKYVEERWELNAVNTAPYDVEIGAIGADKGTAVTYLYEKLGLSKENVLAIGDNMNDIGMLQAAGTAVVMGNASEDMKKKGHIIADTNDNDGVAKIIETILTDCK